MALTDNEALNVLAGVERPYPHARTHGVGACDKFPPHHHPSPGSEVDMSYEDYQEAWENDALR